MRGGGGRGYRKVPKKCYVLSYQVLENLLKSVIYCFIFANPNKIKRSINYLCHKMMIYFIGFKSLFFVFETKKIVTKCLHEMFVTQPNGTNLIFIFDFKSITKISASKV